ncbi:MAG: hypothetical protein WBJ48_04150, partial [Bacteroidales bacterium]
MQNTSNKTLHLISFDMPYPPNYGGIIDVFYKIRALHRVGVNIILHVFDHGKASSDELKEY